MLQLCIECHSLMSECHSSWWNEKYPNACRWFELVFNELLSVPKLASNDGSPKFPSRLAPTIELEKLLHDKLIAGLYNYELGFFKAT